MKALTTVGLTELITLTKGSFIAKNDVITTDEVDIDNTPTSASTNLVTSGGVYTALSGKQDSLPALESGKFLTNNGSTLSWATVSGGTYTAGTGIAITNNVISVDNTSGGIGSAVIDDNSTSSQTTTWSANKLNTEIGNVESALLALRGNV